MESDPFSFHLQGLRSTDSNSLLRLYDRANEVCARAGANERTRVERALQRIVKELRKRNVSF